MRATNRIYLKGLTGKQKRKNWIKNSLNYLLIRKQWKIVLSTHRLIGFLLKMNSRRMKIWTEEHLKNLLVNRRNSNNSARRKKCCWNIILNNSLMKSRLEDLKLIKIPEKSKHKKENLRFPPTQLLLIHPPFMRDFLILIKNMIKI